MHKIIINKWEVKSFVNRFITFESNCTWKRRTFWIKRSRVKIPLYHMNIISPDHMKWFGFLESKTALEGSFSCFHLNLSSMMCFSSNLQNRTYERNHCKIYLCLLHCYLLKSKESESMHYFFCILSNYSDNPLASSSQINFFIFHSKPYKIK